MSNRVRPLSRLLVVCGILAAHIVGHVSLALTGYLRGLEFFNLLLLVGNVAIGAVLLRTERNLTLGAGTMFLVAAHGLIGHRLAPDALTSGAILMVNVLVLYVGLNLYTRLPLRYWLAFVASYGALFVIFLRLLSNAEALFLLFLMGLSACARSMRLMAYFWVITLSLTFFQPYHWEAMLALGFILTAAFAARGRVASPTAVLFLVCGLALVFLVLLPVLVVMLGEDVRNIERVLRDPRVRAAVATTMKTASISTAVLLVGGVPLAYAVSRLRFTGKALVLSLIDIPIVIPQSVAGIALVRVFGRQQFIGEALFAWFGLRFEGTLLGICLAQVFVAMPFLVKTAIAAFDSVPEDLEISARTLGASSWEAFRRVALPLAARGIFLGAVLAWARAAGEFGALLFIAPTPETAPVAAYNRFNSVGLVESAPLVAALLIFTLVMFFLLQFVSRWLPGARGAGEVSFGAAA